MLGSAIVAAILTFQRGYFKGPASIFLGSSAYLLIQPSIFLLTEMA